MTDAQATPASVPFDATALTEPTDAAAVRAFNKTLPRPRRNVLVIIIVVFVVTMFVVVGGFIVAVMTAIAQSTGEPVFTLGVPGTVGLIIIAVLVLLVIIGVIHNRRKSDTAYRLSRFAAANGMTYLPLTGAPELPGMIFTIGHTRMASDQVRGTTPRFVEFGNYRYVTGSGDNRSTHNWGYVAVRLDVPLPNIVLDAVGNNALGTNLPATFRKSQSLTLEGEFNEHFTLYCPAGYEADALYLFTPDIMARFMDHAAQLDVEIVDDWLFLYAQRQLSTTDPATWAWLFGTVAALITKFDQWARWRDERLLAAGHDPAAPTGPALRGPGVPGPGAPMVGMAQDAGAPASVPFAAPVGLLRPPPGVAEPGRRLKRGVNWWVIGAMIFALAWGLFNMFGGLASFLTR